MTFAVIKYHIDFIGESHTAYAIVKDPTKALTEVSPREAKRMIRENGLILVSENEDGKIWDFPDKRWTEKWKGIFARREAEDRLRKQIQKEQNKNLKKGTL